MEKEKTVPHLEDKSDESSDKKNCLLLAIASKFEFILPAEITILIPGLLLTASISAIAMYTGTQVKFVTPLIVAMGVGVLFRNAFILPEVYTEGIAFGMRQVLRFAVALLGVKITFSKILALGWEGLMIALIPLIATYFATIFVGKLMKANESQSMLIATGTSICGASAIMTAGAVTRARSDDVLVAVSSITVFGTFSMLLYPFIFQSNLFEMTTIQYGLWSGTSIHEVAQVIAAAFAGGEESGEIGTMIKLTRVAALVPFVLILSFFASKNKTKTEDGEARGEIKFPFFLFGFIGMVILNSYEFFTPQAVRWIETFSAFLLTMSMAAMGLKTDFVKLLKIGFKPFFLSIFSTGFIALLSIIMIIILT